MKQLLLKNTILALIALTLNIQEVAKSGKFASVIMNNIKAALFFIFSIFFANSSFAQVNINYASGDVISCGAVDGVIPNLTADDDTIAKELRCLTDLEELKLSLYRIGLCTSKPDATNPASDWGSKCVFIMNKTTPLELTLSKTSKNSIDSNIDLSGLNEGTYTHAVLLVGNTLSSKVKATFTQKFVGKTSVGKICYTISGGVDPGNSPTRTNLAVECVDTETDVTTNGNYGHSSKEMNFWGTSSPKKAAANGDDVFLMLNATTLATINTSGKTSNATMIAGILPFSSTQTISANSTSIDIGFQLTDLGQIKFSTKSECSDSNRSSLGTTEACIATMKNYGVGFRITVK